ncbi:hypothetical protein Glo7428_1138 [Gloeocapsa sp. PCC 7428]|uniref:hypothetical protein n=1 Tax=Gloeocapsa sp. PCC 7428 TaxID=1173026 RepID=UPI0002A5E08D|nr:hypothetical protein [Gloeocapsa sp. PCC 7428]AFZ29711.1 hypothetical protein Glo7428_1138 [Gloeocapsa sp. PCC 7428]
MKIRYVGLFGTALTLALSSNALAQEPTTQTPEIELSPQGLEILCERFPLNSRCEGGTPLTGPAPTGTTTPDATTPTTPDATTPTTPGGTTPLDPTAPPVTPLPGPDGTITPDTTTPPAGPTDGTTLPPESPTGGGTRVAPESPINAPDATTPVPGTDSTTTPDGAVAPTNPNAPIDDQIESRPSEPLPGGTMMPAPGTDSVAPSSPSEGVTP